MNEIQELKDRRDQLLSEAEPLRAELLPLEVVLESEDPIEPDRKRELQNKYNELKRVFDSRTFNAELLDRKIRRREDLANCDVLMADFIASMANWAADEIELNEKRQSLSTRLEEVRQQAQEEIASARQAETLAATAYAQAVAWGDVEGEKAANSDAQKAAKNLTAATEQHRRQHLIITALEQELITIDRHITEAQKEQQKIEKKALHLAHDVLEEQWNEAAKALLDVGGKLYAASRMINRDPVSLFKLDIPQQGENSGSWRWSDLADRGSQHRTRDLLSM
ncbi:hypothetical protein SAMN04490202_1593 [Pseudomonas reinekei]|uniref:Chromosome segregation protein SMC n=1 Tax=Pseudomonas reinekei TaxID=395598 RepID=A0A1H0LQC9_PSERE|nr:chromosome segregation protein SMC [Pseudomonas reinekei]KAB0484031.1 chromosome segregation protein SMC [Pseudomonas reinekei]OLU02971.1 chromosome segregation protein SMC [Pseudomonas reinekei]SDO70231.1 hypothetical protein SAMN04490202_1593 [Pseudomonas reinekei]